MKKLIFVAVFFIGFSVSGTAQELDQFQYVRIPERFDFVNEKNQYQLNALTAFLFEKFGFTALYNQPNPEGVDPCDLLYADVHDESGIFQSKLFITLENCNKEIVFTSKTGTSREKDYKASYQEALRNAFESIEALQHTYTGEVVIDPVVSADERLNTDLSERDSVPAEVIVDPVVTPEEREELKDLSRDSSVNHSGRYINGGVYYELKKTNVGYDLFKNGETERFAGLILSRNGENYLYFSGKAGGNAFFDAEGNLIAEFVDSGSGQVISVVYRKDQ